MRVSITSQEILPLRCPICRTRMKWIHRFSSLFHENWRLINNVRQKIFGDANEINQILGNARAKLSTYRKVNTRPFGENDIGQAISEELGGQRIVVVGENKKWSEFESMDIQKARFIQWIVEEYIDMSETVKKYYELPPAIFKTFETYWERYLMMMFDLPGSDDVHYWPLHPNQINDARRERQRLNDSLLLYPTLLPTAPDHITRLMKTAPAKKMFNMTQNALWTNKPYTDEVRNAYLAKLRELDGTLSYTLSVTDEERRQIVGAFGDRSGRWFKCAKGHIYVVTECGGVTEIGNCHECGSLIGGENHRLLEGNYLSTEMDNAEEPLYPAVLNRN